MTSSSADCTLAGARLISSARTRFANTGPHSMSNSSREGRQTRVPTMSAGTRSGVNWSRANDPPITSASVDTVKRLRQPGHALDQAVAPGEQADHRPLDHAVLADDDPLDLEEGVFELRRLPVRTERLRVVGLRHQGSVPCAGHERGRSRDLRRSG